MAKSFLLLFLSKSFQKMTKQPRQYLQFSCVDMSFRKYCMVGGVGHYEIHGMSISLGSRNLLVTSTFVTAVQYIKVGHFKIDSGSSFSQWWHWLGGFIISSGAFIWLIVADIWPGMLKNCRVWLLLDWETLIEERNVFSYKSLQRLL